MNILYGVIKQVCKLLQAVEVTGQTATRGWGEVLGGEQENRVHVQPASTRPGLAARLAPCNSQAIGTRQ
jgi:hypothetical protein